MIRLVKWIGQATAPQYAVPCPTCHMPIEKACTAQIHPLPHPERAIRARVYGFRAIDDMDEAFTPEGSDDV